MAILSEFLNADESNRIKTNSVRDAAPIFIRQNDLTGCDTGLIIVILILRKTRLYSAGSLSVRRFRKPGRQWGSADLKRGKDAFLICLQNPSLPLMNSLSGI